MSTLAWHEVSVEGQKLRYADEGAGPVLVAIDGMGGMRPGRAHALLAEGRRVVLFALPDASDADASGVARLLGAALDALGVDSFDLMGHGLGANVALWLSLLRPRAVRGLILLAPLALGSEPAAAALAKGVGAASLHAHPDRHPEPARVGSGSPSRLLADAGELERRMGDIEAPVLALFGIDDPLAPPELGDRYRANLRDCNLMFVYDAAHLADLDRPEAVAFIAGEFLARKDQFLVSREDGRAFP